MPRNIIKGGGAGKIISFDRRSAKFIAGTPTFQYPENKSYLNGIYKYFGVDYLGSYIYSNGFYYLSINAYRTNWAISSSMSPAPQFQLAQSEFNIAPPKYPWLANWSNNTVLRI